MQRQVYLKIFLKILILVKYAIFGFYLIKGCHTILTYTFKMIEIFVFGLYQLKLQGRLKVFWEEGIFLIFVVHARKDDYNPRVLNLNQESVI